MSAPPTARWHLRRLRLGILDLLEDLAHSRPHQLARLCIGLVIAPANARSLPRAEILDAVRFFAAIEVARHDGIVGRRGVGVNVLGSIVAR